MATEDSLKLEPWNLPPDIKKELAKSMSKALIRESDMSNELQSEALDLIISAVDKANKHYETAARNIKEGMDKKFGPTWHCIVGEGFGFEVTHQAKFMMNVYYQGNVAILLYKC